jgi:hypothetical protein
VPASRSRKAPAPRAMQSARVSNQPMPIRRRSRGSPVFGHDGDSAAGVLADVTSLHAKPHSIDGGSAERGCLYLEFANQVSCRRGKARYLIHAAPSASPVAGSRYKRRGQAEVQRSEAQPLRVCPSSNASGQSEQCWNGGSGSFWVGV